MNRDAATGVTFPSWKAWTAKFSWRRAVFREQVADLSGKRARAEKRALAAEVIAQEASAARLKALLDAAREQATVQTITSAERRFEEARGDWQAALTPLGVAEEDLTGESSAEATTPDASKDGAKATGMFRFAGVLLGRGDTVSARQVALRSTAAASLILGGIYVYVDPDIWGEELLVTEHSTMAAPGPSPAETFGDIDPLVSMSWPGGSAAISESASLRTNASRAPDDAAQGVRTVSVAETEKASAAQPIPSRRSIRKRLVPEAAPTPERNPFYLVPTPSTPPSRPAVVTGIE